MRDRIDFGTRPWKSVPRDLLRDKRLSHQARGGLVTLLSHDSGWVRSVIAILMKEGRRCGREQAQSIMKELCAAGYAELSQERKTNGRYSTAYTVFAESRYGTSSSLSPPTVQPDTVSPSPAHPPAVVEPQGLEPQDLEPEDLPLASAPRTRARDELFETLCELAGWDVADLTKKARGIVNDVAKQLRSVGATPDETRRRADTYRRIHPTWDFTIEALAKHWPGLAAVRPLSKTEIDDEYRQIAEDAEGRRAAQ